MNKKNKIPNKRRLPGIAGETRKRYNDKAVPAPTPTLGDFHTEDQALGYLAEILVTAYFQQKTV